MPKRVYLDFVEIADQNVVAGASITPTYNGIFSAVIDAVTAVLRVYIYSDTSGGWIPVTGGITGEQAVVGQGNKIRFTNIDSIAHNMVVNKLG